MPISIKSKTLGYAMLFCTAASIAACDWPKRAYDTFFFEPNKWQDDIKIGPRRIPAENPGTASAERDRIAGTQKSGGPYAYPPQSGPAPAGMGGGIPPGSKFSGGIPMPPRPSMQSAPQGGNYPAPGEGFQPQSVKLPAWTKGMASPSDGDMPSPYGNPDSSGINPSMPGQHMIRHYEPMANDVYMDGMKVVKPGDKIAEADLPNLQTNKKSMFISNDYSPKVKKTDGKSMFPLEEYTPKSDVAVTSDKAPSFPKITDVPKNPEAQFDKEKINSGINSLIKELDNANAKRDAILKSTNEENTKKPQENRDNDAAALGIAPKNTNDPDSDVLKKALPEKKKADKTGKDSDSKKKKEASLNERRPVAGNIKAAIEKKEPKFIGEDDKVSTNQFNNDLKAILEDTPAEPVTTLNDKDTRQGNKKDDLPEASLKPSETPSPAKAKPLPAANEPSKKADTNLPPPPVVDPVAPSAGPKVTVSSKKSDGSATGLLPNSRYTARRMGQ